MSHQDDDQGPNSAQDVEGLNESSLPNDIDEVEFSSLTIVEMESKLEVGKRVENELVAYGIYCIYARAKGFVVRKGNNEWFNDGSGLRAKDFLCNCEGTKDEKRSTNNVPAYVKPTVRCNCKAKLRVAQTKGQGWRISAFYKEHTHDMYPSDQTYLLKTSRHVSNETRKCIESMVKCGIRVSSAYNFLQTESNGRENVGCIQKDIYDSLSRSNRQSKIEMGDATRLVQHFVEMSNKEPYFYWNLERDVNKKLMNFFFRDYRCSIDYQSFSDVLTVDTTYRTNMFDMICCPFVGINHHGQNVFFGCAFLSDETESSFEWLFQTFLESMGGKEPVTIFTDQCKAMMNAIATVFPKSCHKLCHWHINQNAPSHFGSLNGDPSFKELWHKCMTRCYTEEEFEETWRKMMDDYTITDRTWFNQMYDLRQKWATVFSLDKFSAGLKATSRSESTNAALKRKFGGKTSSLYDCVIDFDKVKESWRMDEKENDTRSHHGRLPDENNIWLKQASDLYTLTVFSLFRKEVSKSLNYAITEQHEIDGNALVSFTVQLRGGGLSNRIVKFDKNTSSVNCSCHKFETAGILCCHALKVLDRMNVDYIPEKYIIRRWRKSMKTRIGDVPQVGGSGSGDVPSVAFVREMMREMFGTATRAQFHKETRLMLSEALGMVNSKLNTWFENYSSENPEAGVGNDVNNNLQADDMIVHDPKMVKAPGITDAHRRHWDAKRKKNKGTAARSKTTPKGAEQIEHHLSMTELPSQTLTTKKGTKRKMQSKQAMPVTELPSQTPIKVTKRKAQATQQMVIPNFPPQIQTPANVQQPFTQQQFHPYMYPAHQAFLVSQPNGTQFSQPISRQFEVPPFNVPLITNQFQRSYTSPFGINPAVSGLPNIFTGPKSSQVQATSDIHINEPGKRNVNVNAHLQTDVTPANANVDAGQK